MADTKITALTAITTVDPANDVLPIVDVSETSTITSGSAAGSTVEMAVRAVILESAIGQ